MISDIKTDVWEGYECKSFTFQGENAILVIPKEPREDKKWLFKTEYFGDYPKFELEMLSRGYYLAHVDTQTRWCLPSDTKRQGEFAEFLHKEFGLNEKCVPVGVSCGGMQAIYLAANYPQYISALYLDAPVLNLLSCPCCVGDATFDSMYDEFKEATGKAVSDLINYRNHPFDNIDKLVEAKIPVFLICGDSDCVVPYHENGKMLYDRYVEAGLDISLILKENADHQPHGLDDCTPLVEFVAKNY